MKQAHIIFILFISLTLQSGCTEKVRVKAIPPDNLIPRDEMVDVIVDMHLYDAIIWKEQKTKMKKIQVEKLFLYESILEKYHITKEQFESSMGFYQSDLEVLDEIYADVITKLSKMKSETEKE
ncbi:MAG: DUF4296 domain-containing protein [Chlorobi bacterium]|nr:DUF4296 domain-containing protein [Chlorobiota bacterium]